MYLVHLALLHAVACIDIQVEGDVAFEVRISSGKKSKDKTWFRQHVEDRKLNEKTAKTPKPTKTMKMTQINMTAAPDSTFCAYQYPEKEQVDSLMSNMMNELTKVFVRAKAFINGDDKRRSGSFRRDMSRDRKNHTRVKARYKAPQNVVKPLRPDDSRFKVVNKKQKAFFEAIYSNMTKEYQNFYNSSTFRVDRSGRDPCAHQDELKQVWRELLEHAVSSLTAATHRCTEEYLSDQHIAHNSGIRTRLQQYLSKELSKVRANQLGILCDTYQLCYSDLL